MLSLFRRGSSIFRSTVASKVFHKHTGIVLAFLALYSILFSIVLPDGVNQAFIADTGKLATVALSFWLLLYVVIFRHQEKENSTRTNRTQKFAASDLALLILPVTPIIQYVTLNQDILSLTDSLLFFLIFCAASFGVAFVIPSLASPVAPKHLLMLLGISLVYCLFSMPTWSKDFNWYNQGDIKVQLAIFVFIFSVIALLYFKQKIALLAFIAFYFFSNTAFSIYVINKSKSHTSPDDQNYSKLYALVSGKKIRRKPDIYLLTYDAYAENETMLQYGIDNSDQEAYLKGMGFKIYNGIYSIGSNSLASMSGVLDVSRSKNFRIITAGNSAVRKILDSFDYKTYGIFYNSYLIHNASPGYDTYYPVPSDSYKVLTRAVGEGQFRFDIESERGPSQYASKKRNALTDDGPQPKFVYSHSNNPNHSQNSGKCLEDEIQRYEQRLKISNIEMRRDVETIVNSNRNAIVIVNGDHGPYLTGDCLTLRKYRESEINMLHLLDRYGTFLAIKWPDDTYQDYDSITILQDIFPAVFSYIFNDETILRSRLEPVSYHLEGKRIYIDRGTIKKRGKK